MVKLARNLVVTACIVQRPCMEVLTDTPGHGRVGYEACDSEDATEEGNAYGPADVNQQARMSRGSGPVRKARSRLRA